MIGDSIKTDIKGASKIGIKSVFNQKVLIVMRKNSTIT